MDPNDTLANGPVPWLLELNFCLSAGFILLVLFNNRAGSPLVAVVARWLRLLIVSIALGTIAYVYEWIDRPPFALIGLAALVFVLAETVRNWLVTGWLSRSELALFPRFRPTERGDEWPADRLVLHLKTWLRKRDFAFVCGVRTHLSEEIELRGSIYYDPAKRVRLTVLFLPQRNGSFLPSLSFASVACDGTKLITDNSFVPFGGFFPVECEVRREPLMRSPERLLRLHERRLAERGSEVRALEGDPIDDINALQQQLEEVNVEQGFLVPRGRRGDEGRLTFEGRYRLWLEMWTLEYLGRANSYRD